MKHLIEYWHNWRFNYLTLISEDCLDPQLKSRILMKAHYHRVKVKRSCL